jgi:hypothetical protein
MNNQSGADNSEKKERTINKGTDSYIVKAAGMVTALFILIYMGFHVVSFFRFPYRTVEAVMISDERKITISGYFVREEILLPMPDGVVEMRIDEGGRVGRNQTIAAVYSDYTVLERNYTLRKLREHRDMLTAIQNHIGMPSDVVRLDTAIYESMAAIAADADRGDTAALNRKTSELRTQLFRREYNYVDDDILSEMIVTVNAQIAGLYDRSSPVRTILNTGEPAYFSEMIDGFESVLNPEMLSASLTVSEVRRWHTLRGAAQERNWLGKLTPGFTWYYAAVLPVEEAQKLSRPRLRFNQEFRNEIEVQIQYIGPPENGECAVVFSSMGNITFTIRDRRQTADIVFETFTGLRIPKQALRFENGQAVVYSEEAGVARAKPVNIIHQTETYYMAEYEKDNPHALREGDLLLLGTNIHDGKAVR